MKVFKVKAENADGARSQLATDLGVQEADIKLVKEAGKEFTFEALSCPPVLDIDISVDKMKARIRRVQLPIGETAPKLTTDFVLKKLKEKGVSFGLKPEVITEELFKILSKKSFDEKTPLNIVVAEGIEPTPAQGGRPQWELDIKLFDKGKPVFCKKGEILARAPIATKGVVGTNVLGENIDYPVEDQFKLTIGKGIVVQNADSETLYKTQICGQLFFDHGVRLRAEATVSDHDEGLRACILAGKTSFQKKAITGKDLAETAKISGINFGILPEAVIQKEIDSTKKWPAEITVARGKESVDGKPGKVSYPYRKAASQSPVDLEKAKEAVVFSGEVVAIIDPPSEPVDGQTVFGETLRGRSYSELPIYPGKNVVKEKIDGKDYLKASAYGRVKIDDDRISIVNMISIDKDGKSAVLDLFPQKALSFEELAQLLRDKDVLFGFDEKSLRLQLEQIHKSGVRQKSLVVAKAQGVRAGKNAKLRYYFKPDDLQPKGVLVKTKPKDLFVAPGDLLLEKFVPVDAEPGYNIYREVVEVSKQAEAVDVVIKAGKNIIEKDMGTYGDEQDPARIQYRAASFGFLRWKDRAIDVAPVLEIDKEEEYVKMKLFPKSDFGKTVTYEMIEALAEEEGIRVPLEKAAILKALSTPVAEGDDGHEVVIAKFVPAVNGTDAEIEYFAEFNGQPIDEILDSKDPKALEPEFCDCVRPGEIIAEKKAAGVGKDGMTVFGRKIIADRGQDEPWMPGRGLDRSEDGSQLIVTNPSPGFLMIQDNRLCVEETVSVSSDRMSAKMTIYPSKNPRFQPREDKITEMVDSAKVKMGIDRQAIKDALIELSETQAPVEVDIALGKAPTVGREARHHFAIEVEQSAGKLREDGSIDYKGGGVFQTVKANQLLLVKEEASRGEDGFNVLGEKLQGQLGDDHHVEPGVGVRVSDSGLEYFATRDGIVEFSGKSIRVIEGLLIAGDVDYSTGNIESGSAQVLVRGSVLTGFMVKSDSDIVIDNIAEACELRSKANIRVGGGIIGKEKAFIYAEGSVEALYINSEATIEANGDVIAENECLTSNIRTGGMLICNRQPGTVSGGEIWTVNGIEAHSIGAAGSESPTQIHLGVNYIEMQTAIRRVEEEGLNDKEAELLADLKKRDSELRKIYDQIPELSKTDPAEAAALQEKYRELYGERKARADELEVVKKQKDAILNTVKRNKDFKVTVRDLIHPGTTFIYKDVVWTLKEPLRGVQITWNEGSSNFVSRRF